MHINTEREKRSGKHPKQIERKNKTISNVKQQINLPSIYSTKTCSGLFCCLEKLVCRQPTTVYARLVFLFQLQHFKDALLFNYFIFMSITDRWYIIATIMNHCTSNHYEQKFIGMDQNIIFVWNAFETILLQ